MSDYPSKELRSNRWTLTGKQALIAGATKGIGRAIAEEFLMLGAGVTIVARNETTIESVIKSWQQKGWQAQGLAVDLAISEDLQSTPKYVQAEMAGELDILVITLV